MNDAFFNRFRSLWIRKQRVQLGQLGATVLLLAVVGLGIIAAIDYSFELDRRARSIALGAVAAAISLYALISIWRTTRQWSQPTTAAEIETAFPQLGQSVRTTVQFSTMDVEQVRSDGVATSLVAALAQRTHQQALPLTIEDIVPLKKLALIAGGFVAGFVLLATASGVDWQWRTATQRTFLNETPYRQLDVRPGDQIVEEGGGLQIQVSLTGRTNREVVLFTREADETGTDWTQRTLDPSDAGSSRAAESLAAETSPPAAHASLSQALFAAKLDKLTKPIEYRVTAGDLASPVYKIGIRHPLRLAHAAVEQVPPSYICQPTSTTFDLNLSALKGTVAKFAIEFDKPVKSASLVFSPLKQSRDDENRQTPEATPEAIVLKLDPRSPRDAHSAPTAMGTAELMLGEDRNYSIVAEAEDGTVLPTNKYRIRVREDQPPQVVFEQPTDTVEVHTLAELLMRIRVWDDYGLSKAGIIFQINNEQEVPLVAQDFPKVVAAVNEVEQTGQLSLTTQTALEKVLPLEFFELTQKDSVMYFAFAEDNRPDKPQRAETDMRFIDIRPFKRTYKVIDPMPGAAGMSAGLKSLEELIQRQRFALNRTLQIEKRAAVGRNPEAVTLNELMKFETELAQSTRDTALGLEARGFDDTELFYQAEAAMLQAVDSLSVGKWENATLQMRDALKALIEQRNRTQEFIMKNPNAAILAALRQFDRQQAQKLRRPKTDKEEARELIRRLEELANQEKSVVTALNDDERTTDIKEENPETPSAITKDQK